MEKQYISRDSILCLPAELICHIATYLETSDLYKLSRTCSRAHMLLNKFLYRSPRILNSTYAKYLLSVYESDHSLSLMVKDLELGVMPYTPFTGRKLANLFPNLETLQVVWDMKRWKENFGYDSADWQIIRSHLRERTMFCAIWNSEGHLPKTDVDDLMLDRPNLRHLSLRDIYQVEYEEDSDCLDDLYGIDSEHNHLEEVSQSLRTLESLKIEQGDLCPEELWAILRLRSVKKLVLTIDISNMMDESLGGHQNTFVEWAYPGLWIRAMKPTAHTLESIYLRIDHRVAEDLRISSDHNTPLKFSRFQKLKNLEVDRELLFTCRCPLPTNPSLILGHCQALLYDSYNMDEIIPRNLETLTLWLTGYYSAEWNCMGDWVEEILLHRSETQSMLRRLIVCCDYGTLIELDPIFKENFISIRELCTLFEVEFHLVVNDNLWAVDGNLLVGVRAVNETAKNYWGPYFRENMRLPLEEFRENVASTFVRSWPQRQPKAIVDETPI